MCFCSIFIEVSSTKLAVHNINMMLLAHHFHLVRIWDVIRIFSHFYVSSQSNRLSFPFRNFLCLFTFIDFLFSYFSPFYKFFLLFTDHSLVLSVKLFPLFFSKSSTNCLMLFNTALMEFSSTLFTCLQLLWVNFILINIKIHLIFGLSNTFFLKLFISCLNPFCNLLIFWLIIIFVNFFLQKVSFWWILFNNLL